MNQNMFSLIKQIEYWLPMLGKVLSNKIQVTKKKRKYKSLRESKERTPGWLPLPSQTTQGFTFSFKKKGKETLNRMSSLFLYCLSSFLHFLFFFALFSFSLYGQPEKQKEILCCLFFFLLASPCQTNFPVFLLPSLNLREANP